MTESPADIGKLPFEAALAELESIDPRSIDGIGESAAEAVIDLIEGRVPVARVSSATLAIRESTRPLRG